MAKAYVVRTEAVRPGVRLMVDPGFTCINAGSIKTVEEDEHGLYIPCGQGRHYLDGQLLINGGYYVGVRLVGDT